MKKKKKEGKKEKKSWYPSREGPGDPGVERKGRWIGSREQNGQLQLTQQAACCVPLIRITLEML